MQVLVAANGCEDTGFVYVRHRCLRMEKGSLLDECSEQGNSKQDEEWKGIQDLVELP
jgi:hypothetical protein